MQSRLPEIDLRDVDPETATLGVQDQADLTGPAGPIFLPHEIAANRFRVVRLLGQGGIAQVFEAEDLELGQDVALKVIRPELAASRRAHELLRREVLLARRVTHPNVCRIFDLFQHFGVASPGGQERGVSMLVLVMELVRGETLSQRLARGGPLTPAEALPIVRQLAEALDAAHRSQVVHGDFKTGNVILESSATGTRAVVTDFGLAQRTSMASPCAGGTTAYMAPEQLRRGELTPASDIYALGVVIHEMVAGKRLLPPHGRAADAVDGAHQPGSPALPPSWARALGCCLAPAPRDRPGSAVAMVQLLEAGAVQGPIPATRRGGHIRRRLQARSATAALLLACLSLLAGSRSPAAHSPRGLRVAAGAPQPTAPVRLAVAIGSFKDTSPRPADPWLPAALGDLIRLEIGTGGQVEAVQLPAAVAGPGDLATGGGAAAVGPERPARHSADLVATGSFVLSRDHGEATVRVRLAIWRPASGEVLGSLQQAGRLADLPVLAARLSSRLRGVIGVVEPSAEDRVTALALRASSLPAEGLYAQGTALLLRGELVESYTALDRALAADPTFALAHAALARVCVELGYQEQAQREAQRAMLPAPRLPEQQRLEIAATRRRADADFTGAAGLFHELWRLAPHQVDYAIQLASTQLEGGRPREAIETLQLIRGRGVDRARASSLDLLEARARYGTSDFPAALTAARAAEEKAKADGNADVLAAAEIEEAGSRAAVHDTAKAAAALALARQLYGRLGCRGGEAEVLRRSAALAADAGATERALALYDQALAVFRQVGASRGAALVLAAVGKIEEQRRNLGRAAELLEHARSELRRLGDRVDAARAANDLALVAMDRHQDARAEQLFEEAVSLDSEAGDREGLASVLNNLANLEGMRGELGAARMHVEEVLRITEELGLAAGEAIGHLNLGCLLLMEGNLHAAELELWRAVRLAHQGNWPYVQAQALDGLGEVQMQEGRLTLAESTLRQGLALQNAGADWTAVFRTLRDLARLRLWEARFRDVEDLARQASTVEPPAGNPGPNPELLSLLAAAQAGQGRMEEALQTIGLAATVPALHEDGEASLFVAVGAARVALAAKRPADAAQRLTAALQRFSATPNPDLVFEARLLLGIAGVDAGHAAAACPELRLLAAQAHRQGFELIAGKAGRLLDSLAACKAAPVRHG
jgi:tRNA A-37 threonylcarbamoyl transferase component Bud32/Tfp pilus assembly protein PilF